MCTQLPSRLARRQRNPNKAPNPCIHTYSCNNILVEYLEGLSRVSPMACLGMPPFPLPPSSKPYSIAHSYKLCLVQVFSQHHHFNLRVLYSVHWVCSNTRHKQLNRQLSGQQPPKDKFQFSHGKQNKNSFKKTASETKAMQATLLFKQHGGSAKCSDGLNLVSYKRGIRDWPTVFVNCLISATFLVATASFVCRYSFFCSRQYVLSYPHPSAEGVVLGYQQLSLMSGRMVFQSARTLAFFVLPFWRQHKHL